jgi:hypothetical protein
MLRRHSEPTTARRPDVSDDKDTNQKVDGDSEADDLEVTGEQADEVRGGSLYEATTKGTHIPEVKIEG